MDDVQKLLAAAYQVQRGASDGILARGHTVEQVAELARDAHGRLDSLLASLPETRHLACRAKCSWCCYERVACSPPEAIAVATYVQTRLVKRDRAGVVGRLNGHFERMRGLDAAAKDALHLPCPFLDDGICLVHQARPLVCRGWHSYDAARCKSHLEGTTVGVPVNQVRLDLRMAISDAMNHAMKHAGLARSATGSLDLAAAVRLVLGQPDAVSAWLRGEDAFADAGFGER